MQSDALSQYYGGLPSVSQSYTPVYGMLCTRYSPVRRLYCYPLDLHVLSLPLAFILSQDQTLRCNVLLVRVCFKLILSVFIRFNEPIMAPQ